MARFLAFVLIVLLAGGSAWAQQMEREGGGFGIEKKDLQPGQTGLPEPFFSQRRGRSGVELNICELFPQWCESLGEDLVAKGFARETEMAKGWYEINLCELFPKRCVPEPKQVNVCELFPLWCMPGGAEKAAVDLERAWQARDVLRKR